MIENTKDYYYTHDISCASALICSGYKLHDLDRGDSRRIKFVILREDGIEECLDKYWDDTLRVNAQRFFNTVKRLKSQIHSL